MAIKGIDSLGNRYERVLTGNEQPGHTAKSTKSNAAGRAGKNKIKCARYRARVGRPNGPGQLGNKSGKNKG